MAITFFSEKTAFTIRKKSAVKKIVLSVIKKEKKKTGDINFIFCNDAYLLKLNKDFLHHNTLTDIITFQYSDKKIEGEVFISIPRVKENAKKFNVAFENELHRVIIHGILHLCGYSDKTPAKKKEMRKKEDFYLQH